MGDNILEIKNLSKNFKDFSLNNLNLIIPRGVIMGLIGENGAGNPQPLIVFLMKSEKALAKFIFLEKITS